MTKVTRKIFEVMEFVSLQGGRGVLPSELVSALGFNQTTCIRILQDLVELGYLEHISRQRGYTLGPLAGWFADTCFYKRDLLQAARPLIETCAKEAGQSVLLSVRHFDKRFVLFHRNFNSRVQIDVRGPFWQDFYLTATGRLLLAYASEKELASIVESLGLPNEFDFWPEVTDLESLKRELALIKERGLVSFRRGNGLFISAFPIWRDGRFEASVGMSAPQSEVLTEAEAKRLVSLLRSCAEAISSKITLIKSAG